MESLENEASVIEVSDLTAKYANKVALKGVSCEVKKNKITAIIGSSGCGKSTLLSCINRTFLLNEGASLTGEVFLCGQDVSKIRVELLRQQVGLVSQAPIVFPMSVRKNIEYALVYHGAKRGKQLREKCVEVLKKVSLFDEIGQNLNHRATDLSGGQKQRLCIARALAVEPKVLLLDEPCSSLDVASTSEIEGVLTSLKSTTSIALVTHNLSQAKRVADEVICIKEGCVVKICSAGSIFDGTKASEDFLEKLYE